MRNLNFEVTKSIYETWRSPKERDQNPILADLHIDLVDENTYQIDLPISFNTIDIRRGMLNRKNYHVACTGGIIVFNIEHGKILSYTKGKNLEVDYEKSETSLRNTNLTFIPKIEAGSGKTKIGVDLGSMEYKKGENITYRTTFKSQERELQHNSSKRHVKWYYDKPGVKSLLRNFLIGNLHLRLTVEIPSDKNLSGTISATPNHLRWFGPEGLPVNNRQNILMWVLLFYSDKEVKNKDGVKASFKEISNE